MKTISISDVTMKQVGSAGDHILTFREKLELAKLLDRLGVSVIELEEIKHAKIDSLRIKSIAGLVKNSIVAVPVGMEPGNVKIVWEALKEAVHPRLQVSAPVSPVQMEYLFHKKSSAVLDAVKETVSACKTCTEDVEFVADDATRSDRDFLYEAIRTAIDAGVKTVTVCDTAGAMLPDEFSEFIDKIFENVPQIKEVNFGVSCSDELSMADACAIAAVRHGATELKTAAYRTNTASLSNIVKLISEKEDQCGGKCTVRATEMKRSINQITHMFKTGKSASSPFDSGVQEQEGGIVLTMHDDKAAVCKAAETLGYELSEEDKASVYESFCRVAGHKEQVGARELDAIIATAAMQVPVTYQLEGYVINSSDSLGSTAHVKLRYQDKLVEGLSAGDGPIDASFLAIEKIIGRHYELDDFQIQAVTEGREAMGETVVKLRSGGKLYSGRGISTDIGGASMMAYINALNKIVYEEDME